MHGPFSCAFELSISIQYIDASYWFVLTSKALSCYNKDNHDVEKFTLSLDAYKMSASKNNNNIMLDLLNSNGQSLKQLKLYCDDDDAFNAWNKSFEWVFNKDLKVCCCENRTLSAGFYLVLGVVSIRSVIEQRVVVIFHF